MLTDSPKPMVDRLTSLINALAPQAQSCPPEAASASILLIGVDAPTRLRLRLAPHRPTSVSPPDRILAAVRITFASPVEQVFGGTPERLDIPLAGRPELAALANILVAEAAASRCGAEIARSLIASALLLMALRVVIEAQPPENGLLAGLAEPRLHRAIVAIHEAPENRWSMEALAERAGMSRSHFMEVFSRVMGMTPGAYLQDWRFRQARQALLAGRSVKETASLAGYSSSAAFSRAFRRMNGATPSQIARPAQADTALDTAASSVAQCWAGFP